MSDLSREPRAAAATLRLATDDDGAELARLRWEFTVEDAGPAVEPLESFRISFARTFRGYLASGRWRVWVAETADGEAPTGVAEARAERSGGRLVGCVWMQWVDRVPRPIHRAYSLGYVTNVYVAPEWRDRGVGSRLLEAAVEDGRRLGHALLFLWPRERSVAFYRRAGFERDDELMQLSLFPDAGEEAPA